MNDEKEKKSDEELLKEFEDIKKELARRWNENEIRKVARTIALASKVMPDNYFSLLGKYTIALNEQVKVMILVAKPENFEKKLQKLIKQASNQEFSNLNFDAVDALDESMKKQVSRRRIDID